MKQIISILANTSTVSFKKPISPAFCPTFFSILSTETWDLSLLWQYQTGIFVLLKQCYYGENTGTFHQFLRHVA